MSGRNLESFMEDASAFDALSDDDKARLFNGDTLEGETDASAALVAANAEETGAAPDAGVVGATEEVKTPEAEPVVQAKDGQHIIPFSELEAARERARVLEQEVLTLKAAAAGQETTQQPAESATPVATDQMALLRDLMREQNEALIMTDTDKASEIGMKILAIQQEISDQRAIAASNARDAQRQEKDAQESAMANAQARANVLVEKYPFLNPQGAEKNQVAIDGVVAERDRLMAQGVAFADAIEQAVAKVAPMFESSTTKPSNADVAKKAAEAISKAKAQVPTSLSQVPAGSMAHHDENEAIRNMDMGRLSRTLEGKSPDEIMKLMSKVL